MAKLRTYVHVKDEEGQTHAFGPADAVPEWAQRLITSPKAWAEAPETRQSTSVTPPAKKAAPAKRTPARRKAAPDAVHD